MVFLEKKKLKGHTYWYASERGLVDGKIKRTSQDYLGTTESIIECIRKSKVPKLKTSIDADNGIEVK